MAAPATTQTPAAGAAILLAAPLLLWPALLNGYPLVFSDTGTYLSQAVHHYLGWDRPVFYSLFLLPLHLTLTTWPAIVVQALLTAATLHLLRRALLPTVSPWWLLPLTGALSIASALPWLASQLMPDLFTGLLVLSLGLLAFTPSSLSRAEQVWLTGFTAFMIAAHQSHLLLVLILLPILLPFRRWLNPATDRIVGNPGGWIVRLRRSIAVTYFRRDSLLNPITIASVLACLALTTVNIVGHHRASVAPFSNVFLLARVIYDGPGMRALQRDCPQQRWRLCPYINEFPANADLFLWRSDSPLALAGGAKLESTEANAILSATLQAEPLVELRAVLDNALRQLSQFTTGAELDPWSDSVTPWIMRDFPTFEVDTYLTARQTNDVLRLPNWLVALHRATALIGVGLCGALLPIALRRRPLVGAFLALVLIAVLINALVTGGLSGPHDRYQARVMWLPPLLAALAIPALMIPAANGNIPARSRVPTGSSAPDQRPAIPSYTSPLGRRRSASALRVRDLPRIRRAGRLAQPSPTASRRPLPGNLKSPRKRLCCAHGRPAKPRHVAARRALPSRRTQPRRCVA
jgi:hypothetical protein